MRGRPELGEACGEGVKLVETLPLPRQVAARDEGGACTALAQ